MRCYSFCNSSHAIGLPCCRLTVRSFVCILLLFLVCNKFPSFLIRTLHSDDRTDGRTDGHSVVCLRKRTKWLHTLLLSSTLSAKDVVAYTVRNVLLVMDAHWNSVLHVQLHLVGSLANGAWLRCTTVSVCMRLRVCNCLIYVLKFHTNFPVLLFFLLSPPVIVIRCQFPVIAWVVSLMGLFC